MFYSKKIGLARAIMIVAIGAGLSACNDSDNESSVDDTLSSLVSQYELTGDASQGRDLPAVTDAKSVLGMQLFFSKSLGGDLDTACVSCHHPALGGGDDLPLPIGVGADSPDVLGPGRTRDSGSLHPSVPRNAPTTYNIALWDEVLFHDGRVEGLGKAAGMNGNDGMGIRTPDSPMGSADALSGETLTTAQARFPVTSAAEMRGETYAPGDNEVLRARLQARLQNTGDSAGEISVDPDGDSVNNWVAAFETVYEPTVPAEDIVTFERVVEAIASYESSQVFVDNAWKSYVSGDKTALTDDEKNGAKLFYTSVSEGGAGCVSCHSGDFFTDESFHNIALPQIGEGKGDGTDGTDDFGRMRETGATTDKYAFRTPTLLNVEHTGPYGHSGAYASLTAMVKHHLQPGNAVSDFFSAGGECSTLLQVNTGETCEDISGGSAEMNTQGALVKLQADQASGQSLLVNAELSDAQVADIVAFLEALTDPCIEDASCISQWIPQGADTIDGNGLQGVDANSVPLTVN